MIVGEGQVWECAKDSRVARYVSAVVEPIVPATTVHVDGDTI